MAKDPSLQQNPDEMDLLREALEGVAPLQNQDRVVHQRQKPPPVPAQRLADETRSRKVR